MRFVWLFSGFLAACGSSGAPPATSDDTDDLDLVDTDLGDPELSVTLEPAEPRTGDPLGVVWSVVPAVEGDWTIRWTQDGAPVPDLDEAEQVPAERTAKGESWSVELRVASAVVAPGSASVVIADTPPEVRDASITPTAPVQGTELSVEGIETFDADGDEVSVEVAWWVGGAEVAQGPTWSVAAPRGASIQASITPTADGVEGPAFQTPAVQVVNTPPSATDVRIEPEAPTALSDLTAMATLMDVDGDPVTATYTWTVDGAVVQQGSSAMLRGGGFAGLALGSFHSCGWRDDGAVVCWGRNTDGQSAPLPIPMSEVAAGGRHSCGLNDTGELRCWGANDFQQSTPPTGSYLAVGAGLEHGCALSATGELVCWGRDQHNQLAAPTGHFTALSVGAFHGCAIREGGEVVCWGRDDAGQASPPDGLFTAVGAGSDRTCGLRADGTVRCWGDGPDAPDGSFASVSVGGSQACAQTSSGEVLCWGSNSHSQLDAPGAAAMLPAVGAFHACALDASRRPLCWGRDDEGQASPLAASFQRGAVVAVSVVPSDGVATGAAASSGDVTIANAPPVVRTLGFVPSPPTALAGAVAEVDAYDPDGDALNFSYRWTLDGQLAQSGPSASLSAPISRDTLVLLEVEVSDSTDTTDADASVVVGNSAPVAAFSGFSPSPARTGADVVCEAEVSDADDDATVLSWAWTRNGVDVPHVASNTFPADAMEAGDALRCVATPSDGFDAGVPADSGAIMVVNGPPSLDSVSFEPAEPTRRDVVAAIPVGASDPDGDAISFSYVWRVGDGVVGTEATLDLAPFARGSVVTVTVTPSDGVSPVLAEPAQAEVVVANSAPAVSVSLPAAPTRAAPIEALVEVDDPDGDVADLTFTWTVAGEPVPEAVGALLAVEHFVKGQQVDVLVLGEDGWGGSDQASASTVVQNAAPSAPVIQVLPAIPVAGRDDLRCAVVTPAEDPDPEDVINYAMTWTVDGAEFTGAGTVTWPGDFVPVDVPRAGETWTCSAQATDGTATVASNVDLVEVVEPDGIGGVGAGDRFSCAVRTDGSVLCWGRDDVGQATPPADELVVVVASGYRHACGLDLDGHLTCWGDPADGRTVPPTGTFEAISSGERGSCALTGADALACWGELALSAAPTGTFSQVDVGGLGACALRTNGAAVCWGDAGLEASAAGSFVDIAVGHAHACGLRDNGAVVCWGSGHSAPPSGSFEQLRAGGTATCGITAAGGVTCWGDAGIADLPTDVARVADLSVGRTHACGWTEEGSLRCWGDTQFGAGVAPTERVTEVAVGEAVVCALQLNGRNLCFGQGEAAVPPTHTFRRIEAGREHVCGVRTNGQLFCWGVAEYGQLSAPGGNYSGLAVGAHHGCAIGGFDMMSCWGRDDHGQAAVPNLIGITVSYVAVAAGETHTCAVRNNRNLRCWGNDEGGMATPPAGNFASVSASSHQSCGIRNDGVTVCWGAGPTPPATSFAAIVGSPVSRRMCGRTSSGLISCWGDDVSQEPPLAAPPFAQVDTGGATCAVDLDGGLWCWDGLRRAPL